MFHCFGFFFAFVCNISDLGDLHHLLKLYMHLCVRIHMAQIFLFACLVAGAWEVIPICLHLLFAHSYISKPFSSLGLQTGFVPLCFLSVFSVAIKENREGKCASRFFLKGGFMNQSLCILKCAVINSFELHFFLEDLNSIWSSKKFSCLLSRTVKFKEYQTCCLTV